MKVDPLTGLLESLQNEREAVLLYDQLAANEKNPRLAEVYRRMSAAEQLFTARGVFYSGMRQVFFGMVAAAVTFGIGRLIGVNLGG